MRSGRKQSHRSRRPIPPPPLPPPVYHSTGSLVASLFECVAPQASSFDNNHNHNHIPLHLTQLSSASLDSSLSDNYRKAKKKKKKSRKKSSSGRRREQRDYRDDYDDESSESDESIENRVKQRQSISQSNEHRVKQRQATSQSTENRAKQRQPISHGRVEEFRGPKGDQQQQQHPQRYQPAPPTREFEGYDYSNRLPGIPQHTESKPSHPEPHQNKNLNLRQPRAHPPGPRPNNFTFDGHTPTSQGTSAFYTEKRVPTNIPVPSGVHRQFGYPQVIHEGPPGSTTNSLHTRQSRGPVITPQSRASSHGGHRDELEAAIVLGSKIASAERSDISAVYSRGSAPAGFGHASSFDGQLPYLSSNMSEPLSGLSKNMRGMQLQNPILSTQSLQYPVGRPRTPSGGGNNLKEVIVPPGDMGITIKSSNKGPIVVDVHHRSICREIRPGDIILALDGVDVTHIPGKSVMQLLDMRKQKTRKLLCKHDVGLDQRDQEEKEQHYRSSNSPTDFDDYSPPNTRSRTRRERRDIHHEI
eukprot:scaffold56706_cov54-Attheya_sp.AAC.7